MKVETEYVVRLGLALRSESVRQFVRARLTRSLASFGAERGCIADVHSLLNAITTRTTGDELNSAISKFQTSWRVHLNRVYFLDYEATRWEYMHEQVLRKIVPSSRLGRCLDIGCGRGCVTAQLVSSGLADEATGIDAAGFEPEWNERVAIGKRNNLEFARISHLELGDWMQRQPKFDTILLLYVLHHSSDYWVTRTLRSIKEGLAPTSRLIVLEDSCSAERKARFDNEQVADTWQELASNSEVYALTDAYDVQVVLDFVAVQLLAGFKDVEMPCTYKRMDEWEDLFRRVGFAIDQTDYLGFPTKRDIDVPQAYFSLRSQT
ncbi:Methyltransferase domain-containing protein [Rhodospirillales bacterium URHD0017]|nr:Methyltransferase domain-containing protein [Rhodospirillales bacterium URHD0017]